MPLFGDKHKKAHQPQYVNADGTLPGTNGPTAATGTAPGVAAPAHNTHSVSGTAHRDPSLPGPAPFTAGPHKHDIMNRLDPTVDSMSGGMQILAHNVHHSGGAAAGTAVAGGAAGGAAAGGMHHSHMHGQHVPTQGPVVPPNGGAAYGSNAGPVHNSRVADKLDPRVDDRQVDESYFTTGPSTGRGGNNPYAGRTGGAPEGTYGPHNSRVGNAMDPRVDSDADHRAALTGAMPPGASRQENAAFPRGVAGPAPTTAGPHRHDWMNKLDPAVDSRPDRTNMVGGNGRAM